MTSQAYICFAVRYQLKIHNRRNLPNCWNKLMLNKMFAVWTHTFIVDLNFNWIHFGPILKIDHTSFGHEI